MLFDSANEFNESEPKLKTKPEDEEPGCTLKRLSVVESNPFLRNFIQKFDAKNIKSKKKIQSKN